MDIFTPSVDSRRAATSLHRTAVCCGIFVAAGLAACGGGSPSDDAPGNGAPTQARPTGATQAGAPGSSTAPPGGAAAAGNGTSEDGPNCVPVASVQVQMECGFSFAPCGPQGVLRVKQGAGAVTFDDGSDRYLLKYENNSIVMTAVLPHVVPAALPYGLDIYRGDVPIVQRQSPRCEPGGSDNPSPCTPDTALAFLAWYDFPTDPAKPRIIPIAPPPAWGTRGNAGPSTNYWAAAPAQGVPNPLLGR
jgi:hypothetical protein